MARLAGDDLPTEEAETVSLVDLVDGRLAAMHVRLGELGTPPAAAATYLAGWFGGALATVAGYGIVAGDCGFVARPDHVRWHLHPGGWPIGVDLEPRAVVAAGHPWEGIDGVVVGDPDAAAVDALVEVCTPVVDACRALGAVGRTGLWNEVADALGSVLAFQLLVPATPERVARLRGLVDRRDVPWRTRPRLAYAPSRVYGTVHVAQKGGCCLAYTCGDDGDDGHCSTCPFREPADCDARQVRWIEDAAARV